MSKNCARCNKVVYAIEELKCLEKVYIAKIIYVKSEYIFSSAGSCF